MSTIMPSIVLRTDSYKFSHWLQQPENTEYSHSAVTPRGTKCGLNKVVVIGLQSFIKNWLLRRVTRFEVEVAKQIVDKHIGPGIFNYEGWMRIVNVHDGYLPVRIKAVPEGTVVPIGTQIVQIENTDPLLPWLPSYLETAMLSDVWYPTTVATLSAQIKEDIQEFLKETSDDQEAINFMLHDFGYRGASSDASARIGGMAHLVSFRGSDTVGALLEAMDNYEAGDVVGFSVIASEHSTVCSNSNAETKDDYDMVEKMVSLLESRVKETGSFQIVSCVADTYDVYRFARDYVGGAFKDRIVNSGGRFVVRPDSGNPEIVPIEIVEILMEQFGFEVNSKGYKVLPPCVRVLQGDGINRDSIQRIMKNAKEKKISVENFVFGMGGALLQGVNRDTLGFAMKADNIIVDGVSKDLLKDPITDSKKRSLKGKHNVIRQADGTIINRPISEPIGRDEVDLMETVYRNGLLLKESTFQQLVERAETTRF